MYFLPKGTVIPAGGQLSAASGNNLKAADLVWDNNVWHNPKKDTADIFDNLDNEVLSRGFD